ncbi:MAG: dTDP-4-dehydrorhamnose reductase [Candidatus Acidiferrales bacterium]
MNLKILLTGKNGQIGYELSRLLPQLGEVLAVDLDELDLLKTEDIRRAIRDIRPNLIVNAAAYTAVDQAEKERAVARALNATAPAVMAEEAKKIGAALVHYSTDYVYDGTKNTPYDERDSTNPLSIYGKTKLEGDQAIQNSGVPHLIFRTAWVYGTRGKNFLLTILRLATEREELRVVKDQTGAPTWSREIALATTRILQELSEPQNLVSSISNLSGIYHLTAGGQTTWFRFAEAILEQAAQATEKAPWFVAATTSRPIVTKWIIPITTEEYPTPARRPLYSVLSNSRCEQTFGFASPDWLTQVRSAMIQS